MRPEINDNEQTNDIYKSEIGIAIDQYYANDISLSLCSDLLTFNTKSNCNMKLNITIIDEYYSLCTSKFESEKNKEF